MKRLARTVAPVIVALALVFAGSSVALAGSSKSKPVNPVTPSGISDATPPALPPCRSSTDLDAAPRSPASSPLPPRRAHRPARFRFRAPPGQRPLRRGFAFTSTRAPRTLWPSTPSSHEGRDEGATHRRRPAPGHGRHHPGRPAVGLGAPRMPPGAHRKAGASPTSAVSPRPPPPRARPTATHRRRPASRSGSCTAGEHGTGHPEYPEEPEEASEAARPPSDRTRVKRLPKRGFYDRADDRRDPRPRDRRARRLGAGRAAVRDARRPCGARATGCTGTGRRRAGCSAPPTANRSASR